MDRKNRKSKGGSLLNDKQIRDNFEVKEVIKKFPKSGQKQVFLVNHEKYGNIILKLVKSGDERVKREIEIVTENELFNVPKVLRVGKYSNEDETGIYLLEQYIQGKSLREIINENTVSLDETLELAETMLKIIVQMEQQKIVHRDVKPENILKSTDGEWFLIDFGIARVLDMNSLTLTEAQVGPHTPGYGAPEFFQYSKKILIVGLIYFPLGLYYLKRLLGIIHSLKAMK